MQDISISYDEALPVPYTLMNYDGYIRIEANPRHRSRIPLWLLTIMQNELLGKIPAPPHTAQPALPAGHSADVIDLTTARAKRAI